MGFWSNLYRWAMTPVGAEKAAAPVPAWHAATVDVERWSYEDAGLDEFNDLYRKLTWVQLAVGTVARTAAGTALQVKRRVGEDQEKIENHPFEMLMQRPNPVMSRFELLEGTFTTRRVAGVAYWWLNRAGPTAPINEIWLMPSHRLRPVSDGRMGVRGYLYDPGDGEEMPLEAWEVCAFKLYNPGSTLAGLSPLEALRNVARGDLAMQKWNTNYFDKDNAKPAGAMAFADPIPDPEWDRMKADVKREHGGTRRSLMMLRNVGAGGVQWVSMAMSQADMQFLEGRTFNKEEIIALYAPGLASVLAVNATEANALAGKKTLLEFGVWPDLMSVAEKITNDILPAYGPDLIAAFDDIRETDRAMRLAEQQAYATVHTIDEIRAEFYQSPPIGDERGKLLPAEVGKTLLGGEDDPEPVVMNQHGPEVATPDPDRPDEDAEDAQEDAQAETGTKAQHIHIHLHGTNAEGAATGQDFFTGTVSLPDGPITPDALKAMVLQLDPEDDEQEQRVMRELEQELAANLERELRRQLNTLLPPGTPDDQVDDVVRRAADQVEATGERVRDVLRRELERSSSLGVTVAFDQLQQVGLGFDWTLAHTDAAEWATQYSYELVKNINATTRQRLQSAVTEWFNNGDTLPDLRRSLEPLFGPRRAQLIAQTETTRAAAEGAQRGYAAADVIRRVEWTTVVDERVCPVCGPLHGVRTDLGQPFTHPNGTQYSIPAHPGCRCFIRGVVED
jgi:HK97 family phage portal protein